MTVTMTMTMCMVMVVMVTRVKVKALELIFRGTVLDYMNGMECLMRVRVVVRVVG